MDFYAQTGSGGGGGFMTGSQGSPGASPGSGERRQNASLRPVTCKQIILATRSTGDSEVVIDGIPATQMVVVAQIQSMHTQSTNLYLTLDDGTGQVETRQWIEAGMGEDYESVLAKQGILENEWVRVMGTIKNFANKRHFNAMVIRPLTNPKHPAYEVHFAYLDALQAKMTLTKGAPNAMTGVTSSNPDASAYAPQTSSHKQKDPFAHLTGMERRIVVFISNSAVGDEGVHLTDLTKGLGRGVDAEDVSNALEALVESGVLYNTTDELWYALSV